VILRRMAALTGESPRLLDGTPLEQVARERGAVGAALSGQDTDPAWYPSVPRRVCVSEPYFVA